MLKKNWKFNKDALQMLKKNIKLIFGAIFLFFYADLSMAHIVPVPLQESNTLKISKNNSKTINIAAQNTITAIQTQAINFGAYCLTGKSGGTISVGWDGSRSSTGNIALLTMIPIAQPAIFEIKLCEGQYVCITYASTSTLSGSNGGSQTFDIGPTEKGISGSSFSINSDCNFIHSLRVGGTLHIPAGAIPGIYSGMFEISFIQQ